MLDMFWHVVGQQPHKEDYIYQMDKIITKIDDMASKTRSIVNLHFPGNPDIPIVRNETTRYFDYFVPERWDKQNESKDPHDEELQVRQDALVALDALIKLKNSLSTVRKKFTRSKKGRKQSDHFGICLNVGYFYYKTFDKMPTSTKNGPFIEVLKVFLQALKLPSNDPSRLIRSAIPELERGIKLEERKQSVV